MTGELLSEAADAFWKSYNSEAGVLAMGVQRGMGAEWIRQQARTAMLRREYWLLASGDNC